MTHEKKQKLSQEDLIFYEHQICFTNSIFVYLKLLSNQIVLQIITKINKNSILILLL